MANTFISISKRKQYFLSKVEGVYHDYSLERPLVLNRSSVRQRWVSNRNFNQYRNDIIVNDLHLLSDELAKLFPDYDPEYYFELALSVISTIYLLTVSGNKFKNSAFGFNDFVQLNSRVLKTTTLAYYKPLIDFLYAYGFIDCNGSFVNGKRSMGYRLGPKYLELKKLGKLKFYLAKTFINPNRNRHRQKAKETAQEKYIYDCLEKVSINKDAAKAYIKEEQKNGKLSETQVESWNFHIDSIDGKAHYQVRSEKCGRVFNLVTNLPKSLRRFLTLDQKPLYNVDVKSCQPLLLAALYPKDSVEGKKYKELVESGNFYKDVADHLNLELNEEAKNEIKGRLWSCIFGKNYIFGEKDNNLVNYYRAKFPELIEIMMNVKRKLTKKEEKAHAKLPILLQKMESEAFIDHIVDKFRVLNIPLLTVHDSILCHEEHVEFAKNTIESVFKELFDLIPSIAVEKC